eukprot:CAMPEP_0115301786 /NCGR_PEP_ID=MMETSP0270-20121206/70041_1 /TAXON_ID=71861 /ORGANISM="Scrippsiella trochoidea, Strain CCMP3099" /LENGTH=395 /DNA_ID=CAMNT_0002719681 /DNA_START=65 /DNA_END=1248 /DNA_ORIENTATION=+
MATPAAQLQPIVAIPPGHLPAPPPSGIIQRSLRLPVLAVSQHPLGISTTIISSLICWGTGYAEISIIDPLIFKSIFIIFGFTMGFRNVRANQRYFDAMQHASGMFMAIWGIYTPMPLTSRLKVRAELLDAVKDVAAHLHRVGAQRRFCWYGIVGLEPASETPEAQPARTDAPGYGSVDSAPGVPRYASWETDEGADSPVQGRWKLWAGSPDARSASVDKWVSGYTYAVFSPLPRLLKALNTCEGLLEEIEAASGPQNQKLRRNFWFHKPQALEHYDHLLSLAFPSVPDRFMSFVDVCLFFFAVSLPWGITAKNLQVSYYGKLSVSAGIVLVINTTLVIMVLFTLNALTTQNEDPLNGDGDDIDLTRLTSAFAYGIQAYDDSEARRLDAKEEVPPA